MADNVDNGIEIQEANGEWGGAVVKVKLKPLVYMFIIL